MHAPDERVLQEVRELLPHGCDLPCLLQFLTRSSNIARAPRDDGSLTQPNGTNEICMAGFFVVGMVVLCEGAFQDNPHKGR